MQQTKVIVDAAQRLWAVKGKNFTTQELVKEAGVALQTFYRHFEGKDQLLLALFEDMITEGAARYEEAARGLPDPASRLRFYITGALHDLSDSGPTMARLVTAEHWRLHEIFPEEMARADESFQALVRRELEAGAEAGIFTLNDPEHDAWVITKLVMSTYHHYACAPRTALVEDVVDHLWTFCVRAVGGSPDLVVVTPDGRADPS